MERQGSFSLSILLRYEERGWAIQCLEYDIAAQGRTISDAKAAFEKAFISQLAVDIANGEAPLSRVPQAPRQYWEQFQKAERLMDRKPFYVPPPFMVRASAEDVRISA